MSNLLQDKYSRDAFTKYVSEYLPDIKLTDSRVEARRGFSTMKQIGESAKLDLVVFEVTPESSIHARMEVSKHTYALLKTHPRAHALLAYHSVDTDEWRLSLITTQVTRTAEGIKETVSNPRRFSYVLGPKVKVNTPTKYLISKGHITDLKDLKERFSLEVVNKDFYREISKLFTKLTGGAFTEGKVKKEYEQLLKLPTIPEGDQRNLEFAVRLIGRVIFCWFLREKKSASGQPLVPKELLSLEAAKKNDDYYHTILEPIFFEVLNKHTNSRKTGYTAEPFSAIPYLNGGLFTPSTDSDHFSYGMDRQVTNRQNVVVPDEWLREFFSFLETYNFTIDENVSFDEELSIDPEMLGRIFENLLAEINPETGESVRNSTGSFYTPRPIVEYMVDHALQAYLSQKTEIADEKLWAVMSYDLSDETKITISDLEKQLLINALEGLKILDPACGSGAFPIGVLQKIVFILQQIDPDARLWFKRQFANASPELRRVIERELSHSNFNYIRKLGVIRENIYGVDIQPIATEIARLRCFLTLIVDERIDDSAENRGIEPLPNLNFKFVTANSLLGLPDKTSPTLFNDQAGISLLKDIRSQFFNSTNSERHQLKDDFKEAQKQMLLKMINQKGSDEATQLLSIWDPFSNNLTPWFDPEWMFGIENGFDLVIGNPPYFVYEGHSKEEIPELRSRPIYEKAFGGKLNAYKLFLALAPTLLKKGGLSCQIFQNSFLGDNAAKNIREFYVNRQRIYQILSFPERDSVKKRVFESVKMSVCIMLAENTQLDDYKFELQVWKDREKTDGYSTALLKSDVTAIDPNTHAIPMIKQEEKNLLTKFYRAGTRLGATMRCYQGEINMSVHKNLLTRDSSLPEVIKGAKIQKFFLVDHMSQGEREYLNETEYLKQNRGAKSNHHTQERLVMQGITGVNENSRIKCAILPAGFYCAHSCNYLLLQSGDYDRYMLLGLLNSTLFNYIFKKTSTNSNVNSYEIENLRLPQLSQKNREQMNLMADLSRQAADMKANNPDAEISEIQTKIDGCVYAIFDLSDEEVSFVKKNP